MIYTHIVASRFGGEACIQLSHGGIRYGALSVNHAHLNRDSLDIAFDKEVSVWITFELNDTRFGELHTQLKCVIGRSMSNS